MVMWFGSLTWGNFTSTRFVTSGTLLCRYTFSQWDKISYSMLNCFGLLMLICFVILRWRLTESIVTMITMETKSDLHQRFQLSMVWPHSHGPLLIIFGTAPPMLILKLLQTFRITVCIPWWVVTATQRARTDSLFIIHDIVHNSGRAVDWGGGVGGGRPGDSEMSMLN
jgi:hypothetical protein